MKITENCAKSAKLRAWLYAKLYVLDARNLTGGGNVILEESFSIQALYLTTKKIVPR